MTLLRRIVSVLRRLLRPARAEQELDDDLRNYLEESSARKIREGIPPAEAHRMAVLELGGLEQAKERVRTQQHGAWLEEIGRDVRYGSRLLRRSPGFTLVIVLTLTLGIGANTAIFALIDALMLRPLPVHEPQQLVQVSIQSDARGASEALSYAIVGALAGQREIFAGVAGFNTALFDVGLPGSIVKVPAAIVTGGYYDTLGLKPVTGRLLGPSDDQPSAPAVAVLGHGYWERQFARRADIAGTSLLVNGVPVTIVGVSPRGFTGAEVGSIADITVAVAALPRLDPPAAPLLGPGNFWLRVLARPRQGLSASDAEARFAAIWPRIAEPFIAPHWPESRRRALAAATFRFSPGATGLTFLRSQYGTPLVVLMGVVALVLLIACANVASLLLARASARQREIAVRLAIGAGRRRIVRQFLIESLLLSAAGALLGVGVASFSSRFLVGMISGGPARVMLDLSPNWRVLGFTSAVAIATGLFFGIAPAFQASSTEPAGALKEGARISASRSRLLPALVSAQVALALVLLVGASLFGRTLHNLRQFDSGFNAEGVLLVDLPAAKMPEPSDLLDAVQRAPGIRSASLSTHTPLSGSTWSEPAVPAGQPLPDVDTALFVGATARFFETMQIPLLAGRSFTSDDSAQRPPVAIVNERFAQKYFAKQSPIGQRLSAGLRGHRTELTIVGLVKDVNATGPRDSAPPMVYVAFAQMPARLDATLEARIAGPAGAAASAIREAVQQKMTNAAVEVRSLSGQVDDTMLQERMMALFTGAFAVLGLGVACVGLYGLLAYGVARRVKEIGIRLALGADRNRVIALVMKNAGRLVLIGIAAGIPAAWMASRWIASLLFGLSPGDPAAVAAAIVALTAAVFLAAYVPAHRASRLDPIAALRHE